MHRSTESHADLHFVIHDLSPAGSRIPPSPPPPPPPPVAVAPLAAGSQGWQALNWTVSEGE